MATKDHEDDATTLASLRSPRHVNQWPLSLSASPAFSSKLVIVLIGLPARGKSYIATKLTRYLNWIGFNARVFNAGNYRRSEIGSGQSADFYNPSNIDARNQKRKLAMKALSDLLSWVDHEDNFVGIFDATNSTRSRRKKIIETCAAANAKVLFLESICTDAGILAANYKLKLQNEDYRKMDPEVARADFAARVAQYEAIYETLSDDSTEDSKISYIKLINVGAQIITNACSGYMLSQITTFLPNLHITPKRIYLTRHGETFDNVSGHIGGDSSLTDSGKTYAKKLHEFITSQNHSELTIWTSTLGRAVQTALPFKQQEKTFCYQTRLLNEIHAGACEGMTYKEIEETFPVEFAARVADKFHFRYARGGESYVDIMERVKPLILELERHQSSILVISHRAILRTILAYFCEIAREKMVYEDIPLNCVFQLCLTPFGCEFEKIMLLQEEDSK